MNHICLYAIVHGVSLAWRFSFRKSNVWSLSDKLTGILDKLKKRGALSEDDVKGAMREVRIALFRGRRGVTCS